MSPQDRRRAEAAFVRNLPNYAEIRTAHARDLHYPADVVGVFTEENIVMTPMNLDPPDSYMLLSRFDYVQEHAKFLHGGATWDDTPKNSAKVGDLFAFVFYQPSRNNDRMELFHILDILGPEHRRPNWIIAEHANRRVLRLSKYLGKVPYSAFAAAKGYSVINEHHYSFLRGTTRTRWPQELEVDLQAEIKEEAEFKEEAEKKEEVPLVPDKIEDRME